MITGNMQSTWVDLQQYQQTNKCAVYDNRLYADAFFVAIYNYFIPLRLKVQSYNSLGMFQSTNKL